MTISKADIARVREYAEPVECSSSLLTLTVTRDDWNALCDAAERGAEVTDSEVSYEIWQDEEWCAEASGAGAIAEALHYASVYGQDGPVEIYRVTRSKLDVAAFANAYNAHRPTPEEAGK